MPKVLLILNRFIIGGPALQVTNLAHYMGFDYEIRLVVGNKNDHEKSAELWAQNFGIDLHYVSEMSRNISPLYDYLSYLKIKKIIKDFKPDIVHTHGAKSGAIGRMAAASMKVPVIIHTFHGHVFHSYFGKIKTNIFLKIERFLAKKTDALVAISQQQKQELCNHFKIAGPEKFRVIPLGLDLQKFQDHYADKRKAFRSEFGLPDQTIAIGIIGRLAPIKNHRLFLKAIAFLLKNSDHKIKAFIVGDGEMRSHLEIQASDLSISFSEIADPTNNSTLVFTSWRNDIDTVNAGLDIVCLTSLNEGTPISLIEAQASNKPIISTRVGGIVDIVEENQTGLLSNINDTILFMNNLLMIVNDEVLRKKLGRSSFDSVKLKFGYDQLVQNTGSLYKEVLSRKTN